MLMFNLSVRLYTKDCSIFVAVLYKNGSRLDHPVLVSITADRSSDRDSNDYCTIHCINIHYISY